MAYIRRSSALSTHPMALCLHPTSWGESLPAHSRFRVPFLNSSRGGSLPSSAHQSPPAHRFPAPSLLLLLSGQLPLLVQHGLGLGAPGLGGGGSGYSSCLLLLLLLLLLSLLLLLLLLAPACLLVGSPGLL